MPEIVLFEKRNEDTDIDWWRESRKKLNKIIKRFNKWQTKHNFNRQKSEILLARIELSINTIGKQDGGAFYLEELEKMRDHVLSNRLD